MIFLQAVMTLSFKLLDALCDLLQNGWLGWQICLLLVVKSSPDIVLTEMFLYIFLRLEDTLIELYLSGYSNCRTDCSENQIADSEVNEGNNIILAFCVLYFVSSFLFWFNYMKE